MALKITRRAPTIDGNIAAGNTLTLKLPIGLTHHQVYLEYAFLDDATPVALADAIGEIRVIKNGKPSWNIQGAELDKLNQFDSRLAAGGILTIDFDRYNMRSRDVEEFTSVGTGAADDPNPLTTFVMEIDLKSGSGVDGGTVSARLRQSEARPLGLFKKLRRYVYNYGASGEFEIADFPKGDLINRVNFLFSANAISRLRLLRDNFDMFDRSSALNTRIQSDGVRTPQSLLYSYDTTEDGNGTDLLVTRGVNDLRFILNTSGALTLTPIVEYVGALES